jgi:ABC-type transporter Mla MlaB component
MLRITTHDDGNSFTYLLEGKLAGPWVALMRDCWEHHSQGRSVQVDLRGVTYVDTAGRGLLAEMTARHAKLIARDCLMKGILAEIAGSGEVER